MAATPTVLYRGAASLTTTTTLYTTPALTTTVVSNIIVANTTADNQTYTLYLGGTVMAAAIVISGNTTEFIDIKQTLDATDTIQGGASDTGVNFIISGVEII